MAEYNVKDGTRITLDSAMLNFLLNECNHAKEIKATLFGEIHRQEVQDFLNKNFNLPRNNAKRGKTKLFIEVDLETVPCEMTARFLLKLIENYCIHFDKFIATVYSNGTKTLEFR